MSLTKQPARRMAVERSLSDDDGSIFVLQIGTSMASLMGESRFEKQ